MLAAELCRSLPAFGGEGTSRQGESYSRLLVERSSPSGARCIAPLLVPTDVFSDDVRWANLVDLTVSNFLFGLGAGFGP